jgi:hypothetical protein
MMSLRRSNKPWRILPTRWRLSKLEGMTMKMKKMHEKYIPTYEGATIALADLSSQ